MNFSYIESCFTCKSPNSFQALRKHPIKFYNKGKTRMKYEPNTFELFSIPNLTIDTCKWSSKPPIIPNERGKPLSDKPIFLIMDGWLNDELKKFILSGLLTSSVQHTHTHTHRNIICGNRSEGSDRYMVGRGEVMVAACKVKWRTEEIHLIWTTHI